MKKFLFVLLSFMLSAQVNASTVFSFTPTDGDVDGIDLSDLTAFPDPNPMFALVGGATIDPNLAMKFVLPTIQTVPGGFNLPSFQFAEMPTIGGFLVGGVGGVIIPDDKFNIAWLSPSDNDWHLADTITQKGDDIYLLEFEDVGFGPTTLSNPQAALLVGDVAPSVTAVPVPAAAWLFGSGLIGLAGVARRHDG